MKIESSNNRYVQQNINKSANNSKSANEEKLQIKTNTSKDILELSDTTQKMELIKNRISSGYYNQKEVLQKVATKLYNDVGKNNHIDYKV